MEKQIEISNVTLNYTVEGEGRPVVLMHGWGCNLTTVASINNLLTPGFRVYNIDFPGFGKSTEPTSVWGVDDYAAMMEEFMRRESIVDPILIGHSFGGRVAIVLASRNKTHKIILVDAAGVKPRRSLRYYFKVYSYKAVRRTLPLLVGRSRAEDLLNRYRKKVGSSDYSSASPRMRQIMSRVVNEDLCHLMPKIACPTLLIWGALDTATPVSDARKMEKLIADAGLVVFEGAGHYSFLDNPYQFAAVVNSFLDKDKRKQ
ncbi:MAG: alpha/beta fold hydrolase [Candidatus Limisoma sp.]